MNETLQYMRRKLVPVLGKREAEAVIRLAFRHVKGWDTTGMVIHQGEELSDYSRLRLHEIADRVAQGEPIQYITGFAYFHGMDFKVTPDVLIPRVETQELVDLVIEKCRGRADLDILDAGTGSGCIAIALARNCPFSRVTAIDISPQALAVAKENGEALHTKVDWLQADIFNYTPAPKSFDLIVSNPPYVTAAERGMMETNVVDHEPWLALFVPDDDPLRFYRRICSIGREALKPGGRIWFELNALYTRQTADMARGMGYEVVDMYRDIAGKERFLELKHGD